MFDFLKRRKKTPIKYAVFLSGYDSQIGGDSTSFAAIDLICGAFASLGFDFYNYSNREKTEHSLKELLEDPNGEDTRFLFFYNSAKDYFQSGNVYWYKYDIDGEIVSLFRINPNDVRAQRDVVTNEKQFYYNGAVYTSEKIMHIPSRFGYNGLVGNSIFSVCGDIFKNASNLDLYVKNSFTNSVGKRLVIDISQAHMDMTNEQIEELKEKFIRDYGTIKNAGVPLIKRKGISYEAVDGSESYDNRAQQLAENRRFQEGEIAKILRVPVELLNGTAKDLESLYTMFLDNAVRPLAASFEQAVNKFLLNALERKSVYFEFSYNSLVRTDMRTRVEMYAKEFGSGMLSLNEIRQKENMPIIEERAGDTKFIPSNLMPVRDEQIDALLAGAQVKLGGLKSNSDEFHEENPSGLGDDKT
jgi:HK97 family phage portal protein